MSEVVVEEEIAAPAAAVWEVFADFGGVASWSNGIESCVVEGDGVGAVRVLGLPGGAELRERLEALDPDAGHFSYSIVEPSPVPFTDYVATVDVRERGPERCEVRWCGRFRPTGVSEEQAAGIVRSIYSRGLAAMRRHLGAR